MIIIIMIQATEAVKSQPADYIKQITDQQSQLYELQITLQVNEEDLENVTKLVKGLLLHFKDDQVFEDKLDIWIEWQQNIS